MLEAQALRQTGDPRGDHDRHGADGHVAALVVSLTIRQFETELAWLGEVNWALRGVHREFD
ncbi:MAG: hypothetical protein U5K74_07520 [Gemmatimonadaceae bacterium]|nr:hypothetical protein [Gemmatimonadaceae bacterium]